MQHAAMHIKLVLINHYDVIYYMTCNCNRFAASPLKSNTCSKNYSQLRSKLKLLFSRFLQFVFQEIPTSSRFTSMRYQHPHFLCLQCLRGGKCLERRHGSQPLEAPKYTSKGLGSLPPERQPFQTGQKAFSRMA